MRPIDADKIQYTMLYKENWISGTGKEAQGVWKSDIDKMPTVDVRKEGKWVEHYENPFLKPTCSECGAECFGLHRFDYIQTNYCPNCGAKMSRHE